MEGFLVPLIEPLLIVGTLILLLVISNCRCSVRLGIGPLYCRCSLIVALSAEDLSFCRGPQSARLVSFSQPCEFTMSHRSRLQCADDLANSDPQFAMPINFFSRAPIPFAAPRAHPPGRRLFPKALFSLLFLSRTRFPSHLCTRSCPPFLASLYHENYSWRPCKIITFNLSPNIIHYLILRNNSINHILM